MEKYSFMTTRYGIILRESLKVIIIGFLIILLSKFVIILSLYLAPFLIAFIISLFIEPVIRFLGNKLKLGRKVSTVISILIIVCSVGAILAAAIARLVVEIAGISNVLPQYFSEFYSTTGDLMKRWSEIYNLLPPQVAGAIEKMVTELSNALVTIINSSAKWILATAISAPQALVFIFVTILSTYFFSSDKENIYRYFKSHLPDKWISKIGSVKRDMFSVLIGYIKAQLILMSITFSVLFIGFAIMRLKYSLMLAVGICLVDALPILGIGSILIPWSIVLFIIGDTNMGISIALLYVIALIIRHMTEPKILSSQVGMHPLLMLIVMYVGLKLFGVWGLIFGPLTAMLFKSVMSGVLKREKVKHFFTQFTVQ